MLFTNLLNYIYHIYHILFAKKWYIIEGNIGCGKTTLISQLKERDDFEVIEEPVEVWKSITNEEGENILGMFYKESKKYAYIFQTIVFKTRMMALERQQVKQVRFSERSIWTDKNIFSKNCYEIGFINTIEKNTYDIWFNWLESKITRKPDGIIYLRAEPETCFERVHKRDRSEEATVSIDYLTNVHIKHEEWLMGSKTYGDIPIYIIDNTYEPSRAFEKVQEIVRCDGIIYKAWKYLMG
jgi:deoxyadenosine/deoxycytidine kinase